jgi:hypothetical protein
MAELQITNTDISSLYLGDFYTTVEPGKTVTVERPASDLPRLTTLQKALAEGKASLSVTYSADEAASGLHAPPSVIEAGDIAPVAGATPAAPLVTIYKPLVAGGGGSPDDVEIYPVDGLPFKFRILDLVVYVSSSPGASTVEIRDEAGGGGNLLASADTATTGRKVNAEEGTGIADQSATTGLFVRRSDDAIAGEVVITARAEL